MDCAYHPGVAQPAAATPQPGAPRAVDAALQGQSSWQWQVKYHTEDWQRAKIWIGPSASRITTEVILQWNSSSSTYSIERKSAIPREEGPKPSRARVISSAKSGHGGGRRNHPTEEPDLYTPSGYPVQYPDRYVPNN